MNRAQLIEIVASNSKLTKIDVNRVLDATLTAITKSLKKGDRVNLVGFGVFKINKRAGRIGRNPKTGVEVKIAPKRVVKFKPGLDLAEAVKK